jgi:hypothetical protein
LALRNAPLRVPFGSQLLRIQDDKRKAAPLNRTELRRAFGAL